MTQPDFAAKIGRTDRYISKIERGLTGASRPTLDRIVDLIGPVPRDAWTFLKKRWTKWGQGSTKRRRDRVSKLDRSHLVSEIAAMGLSPAGYMTQTIPYVGPVGNEGCKAWLRAKAASARNARTAPLKPRARVRGRNPRQKCRQVLRGLQAERTVTFQCYGCGDVIGRQLNSLRSYPSRPIKDPTRRYCRQCWLDFYKDGAWMAWVRGEIEILPQPRRRRGNVRKPHELRGAIIDLLRWVLGDDAEVLTSAEYRAFSQTRHLLQRSRDNWARSLTEAVNSLKAR